MTEQSPLTEAAPDSLDELFARYDKAIAEHTLSSPQAKQDLDSIVAEYRRQREVWAVAEASGAKRAPKNGTKKEVAGLEDILGAM